VIAALAAPSRARLHLLHVVHSAGSIASPQQPRQQAQSYLKVTTQQMREGWVASKARLSGLTITWSVATHTHVTEALLRTAESDPLLKGASSVGPYDLIAVTTHRLTHLPYRVMGEASRRLLQETRLPVLMVHPAERAGETIETSHLDMGVPSSAR
jgi:nucleotide-binding universal stress UspA family protein